MFLLELIAYKLIVHHAYYKFRALMFHDILVKAASIVSDNNLQLPSNGAQVVLAACTAIGKQRAPSSSNASPHAPPSSVIETASKQAIGQQQNKP